MDADRLTHIGLRHRFVKAVLAVTAQPYSEVVVIPLGVASGETRAGVDARMDEGAAVDARIGIPTGMVAPTTAGVPPQSLKLAGLAAFFGLQQRRRTEEQANAPHDDPYAAYLRWSDGNVSALDDREAPAA